jgi:hypothetical protein
LTIWIYILAVPVIFVAFFLIKGIYQGVTYYDIAPRNFHDIKTISGIAQVQSKQMISRENYLFVKPMVNISPELDELALSWEQWYDSFKKESAAINSQLIIDKEGLSLVDLVDDEPLKNAYRDQQNPLVIAREFAENFDFTDFGY